MTFLREEFFLEKLGNIWMFLRRFSIARQQLPLWGEFILQFNKHQRTQIAQCNANIEMILQFNAIKSEFNFKLYSYLTSICLQKHYRSKKRRHHPSTWHHWSQLCCEALPEQSSASRTASPVISRKYIARMLHRTET